LNAISKAYFNKKDNELIGEWERARWQAIVISSYCRQTKKGPTIKDLPFNWDKKEKEITVEEMKKTKLLSKRLFK
jgi:hypothetical protein